jgi:hypothetical protein
MVFDGGAAMPMTPEEFNEWLSRPKEEWWPELSRRLGKQNLRVMIEVLNRQGRQIEKPPSMIADWFSVGLRGGAIMWQEFVWKLKCEPEIWFVLRAIRRAVMGGIPLALAGVSSADVADGGWDDIIMMGWIASIAVWLGVAFIMIRRIGPSWRGPALWAASTGLTLGAVYGADDLMWLGIMIWQWSADLPDLILPYLQGPILWNASIWGVVYISFVALRRLEAK